MFTELNNSLRRGYYVTQNNITGTYFLFKMYADRRYKCGYKWLTIYQGDSMVDLMTVYNNHIN